MCGLVGVAGKTGKKEEAVFHDLLIVSTLRGADSSGVLFRSNTENTIVKKVGSPFELFDSFAYNKELGYSNQLMLGHTRYSTRGESNKANAHPFEFGDIIGAHNGTLTTQYLLDDWKDFEVDSENIFYHMERKGLADTLLKCGGAFALTWLDAKDGTFNMVRNAERPLYITFSKDEKTLFWASESWMLIGVLGRNGVEHGTIDIIDLNTHYSIPLDNGKGLLGELVKNVLPVYAPFKQAPKKATPTKEGGLALKYMDICGLSVDFLVTGYVQCIDGSHYMSARLEDDSSVRLRIYATKGTAIFNTLMKSVNSPTPEAYSGFIESTTTQGGSYGKVSPSSIEKYLPMVDGNTLDVENTLDDEVYEHDGNLVSLKEWLRVTINGCAWCTNVPALDEHEELVWLNGNDFVCHHCAQSDEVKEIILP